MRRVVADTNIVHDERTFINANEEIGDRLPPELIDELIATGGAHIVEDDGTVTDSEPLTGQDNPDADPGETGQKKGTRKKK